MLTFLKFLTKPAPTFTAPELRRRIVVLNSLMLTYTLFVFILFILSMGMSFSSQGEKDSTITILGICSLIFMAACAVGRTRFYIFGGLVFSLTIYIGCFTSALQQNSIQALISILPFMIIPALIGAFLFPLRIAILNFALGLTLSIGLAIHFNLFIQGARDSYMVFFNIIVYVILFVGTMLRVWDEKQMIADRLLLFKNAKMQTLGQMAGNIAHEMNSPIGAIILRASQIVRLANMDGNTTPQNAKVISIAGEIEKIGKDIALTVEGLRRFSRNEENLKLQPVRVAAAIENTLRICSQRIESNGIKLTVSPFSETLEVLGSDFQISQILVNLLSNAQQAIKNLPEKWITLAVEESEDRVRISVTDSGKGIPKQVAAKIFEPFFTTKEIGEGTGLGLSISYGIASQLGGQLFLDSECLNTKFVISLRSLRNSL